MHTQQRVTELTPGVTFRQHIWHGVKIAQRLRHFLSIHEQMRAVQPVTDEFFFCDAFTLCDFRFVMRENIIDAAAMDIELIP